MRHVVRLVLVLVSSRAEPSSARGDSAAHNLPRIELRALPVAEALALLAGSAGPGPGPRWHLDYPMSETLDALGMLTEAHAVAGWAAMDEPQWWLQQIVLDHEVVGDVGFHGPPPADGPVEVEIGYNVVEGLRGLGIATRACALLLERAWAAGADAVAAETTTGNVASQRVLLRNGFVHQGDNRYLICRPPSGQSR